ncbi:MAG: 1-acyl-sn-glycerol-3-phosphate acyltransferase [Acidimicrobiales bacterium]|nr:1-acyl-sn-glycerol-3-phosphate acyltransferase [Acidimicrobiales bacterium]
MSSEHSHELGPGARILYRVVRGTLAVLCRLWFRLSIEGRDRFPASGAFIVAPVHRSNLDTFVVGVAYPGRLRYLAKDSLWKHPWLGWLVGTFGGFPVKRGSADREALRTSIEVLERGEPLVVYPEGTRQAGPLVQPFFDGAAYLAGRCRVPIVPVGIGGSERAMTKGSPLIRPVKIHVIVGEPVPPPAPGPSGRVPRRAVRELSDRLHEEIQVLFDVARVRAGD